MKTKKEAAKFLGVSVRTLLRHTAGGRIAASQRRGSRGAETVYDDAELERFKGELEGVTYPVRPLVTLGTDKLIDERLSVLPAQLGIVGERLMVALEAIAARASNSSTATVSVADKVMLTVTDAAALTTLSRSHLLQAMRAGKLKAKIIGRAWRIKRADLDVYVKKL